MTAWPIFPLGDVLSHRKEFIQIDDALPYKRCRVQLHAQGIVLRDEVPGIEIKTKAQQVCREGEFLVAEIDAKVGGFGIVPAALEGAIVSSHYFLFTVNPSILDVRFLGYYVKTAAFRDQVTAQGSTNYAAIRPSHVLSYTMPLPSLEEQRRVVAWLDCANSKFERLAKLRLEVLAEIDSLPLAFAGSVFSISNVKHWTVHKLGEIADIRAGVTLGRKLAGKTVRLPYLRVANVQAGHLDLREVKDVEILPDEYEKWKLLPGDILLTEGGDWDKLGRGTVWNGEIPDCIHQNHIFRLRVGSDLFDPYFLAAQIGSPEGKAYFQTASKQTTNLASINQRQLKAFPVCCPSLAEQRVIVARLNQVQNRAKGLKRLSSELEAETSMLKSSILNRSFSTSIRKSADANS